MKSLLIKFTLNSLLFMYCLNCYINTVDVHAAISKFRLSGYGTLGYTVDDRSDMAPMRDFSQKPDDGFRTGATWKLDSRLALQAHYRFSTKVDCIVQGVLRDQVKQNFANSMELAYVGWKPHAKIDVRAGRLGYDAFLMSDTRNLGYSYLWVRPPPEFYAWTPIFSVDGMDLSYMTNVANWQLRFKAQAGVSHTDVPVGEEIYDVDTHDLWSTTIHAQSGPIRIKAGFAKITIINEAKIFEPLHNGLGKVAMQTADTLPWISAEASFLQKNISFKNMDTTYMTLGTAYDDGTWIAQAEISHSTVSTNLMPQGNMGYVGMGRRFGDWTPYLLFSMTYTAYDIYTPHSDWSVIGMEELQSQAIRLYNGIRTEQKTYSMGVRWDLHNQAAVKLQWDNSHVKPYYGLWWRSHPVSERASHVNMWTFSLEYMF